MAASLGHHLHNFQKHGNYSGLPYMPDEKDAKKWISPYPPVRKSIKYQRDSIIALLRPKLNLKSPRKASMHERKLANAELMKTMRKMYEDAPLDEKNHLKSFVHKRNSQILITEYDKQAKRQAKFERGVENMDKGYLSDRFKAYQPIGYPVLDTVQLFEDVIGKPEEDEDNADNQNLDMPAVTEQRKSEDLSKVNLYLKSDAGLSFIKTFLTDGYLRKKGVSCGQSYFRWVKGHKVPVGNKNMEEKQESVTIIPLARDFLFRNCKVPHSSFILLNGEEAVDEAEDDEETAKEKAQAIIKAKQTKELEKELEAIYYILCTVVNLKNRHLRRIGPLTPPLLAILQRNPYEKKVVPQPDDTGCKFPPITKGFQVTPDPSTVVPTPTLPTRTPTPTPTLPDEKPCNIGIHIRTPESLGLPRKSSGLSLASKGSFRPGDGLRKQKAISSATFRSASQTSFVSLKKERKTKEVRKRSPPPKPVLFPPYTPPVVLKTWEDLLALGMTKVKSSKLSRKIPWRNCNNAPNVGSESVRNEPPMPGADGLKNFIPSQYGPSTVNKMTKALEKAKQKEEIQILKTLDVVDQEREIVGKHKFQKFSTAQFPWIKHFAMMRHEADGMQKYMETVIVKSTPWYDALKAKVDKLQCHNNRSIKSWIKKLYQFVVEDVERNNAHALEKLCLLTCSLPIKDILTLEWQRGIKYVMSKIYDLPEEHFGVWIATRQLYEHPESDPL